MKCFSESLGIIESQTSPGPLWHRWPNLNEDKVACFAGSSHLVSVPGDEGGGGISWMADVKMTNGYALDTALESDNVDAINIALHTTSSGRIKTVHTESGERERECYQLLNF